MHGLLPVSAEGYDLFAAFDRLRAPDVRIIGWGTGSVFEYFHQTHPFPLEYLVDNDSTRWGSERHGLRIESPERLLNEDPSRVLVIIYSGAWTEILAKGRTLAGLIAMPASALLAGRPEFERLRRAAELATRPLTPGVRQARDAVVIQGPFVDGMTPQVLRAMRAAHSRNLIVLSTWRDTDPARLDQVRGLVDEIVLNDLPKVRGIQNRNCQIVSTAAGVARARGCGARTILKTRTDLAVLAPDVFERGRQLLASVDSRKAQALGLRGRIVVPANFTRKFLPYHPSDLVMLAAADDMAAYWAAPLDPRDGNLLAPEWLQLSLTSLALAGQPAEGYLGTQFCQRLGRPVAGTLADSWAFLRDLFVVVDNEWFDLLWLKNLLMPDATRTSGPLQLMHHAFWRRLLEGDPRLERDLREVDPEMIDLRKLTGAAA